MTYRELLAEFIDDDVQRREEGLGLINPHHDPMLASLFAHKKQVFDYLHNQANFDVQFVGSHWWNSEGLYKQVESKRELSNGPTCPFDARIGRLRLKEHYQFSNCAMGYIPKLRKATGYFTEGQIEYLRPRKLREYEVVGTRVVFVMGDPAWRFHVYGTGHAKAFPTFTETIVGGPVLLCSNLLAVPMPHPGGQGIVNYLRRLGKPAHRDAQDSAFQELIATALAGPAVKALLVDKGVMQLVSTFGDGLTSATIRLKT